MGGINPGLYLCSLGKWEALCAEFSLFFGRMGGSLRRVLSYSSGFIPPGLISYSPGFIPPGYTSGFNLSSIPGFIPPGLYLRV